MVIGTIDPKPGFIVLDENLRVRMALTVVASNHSFTVLPPYSDKLPSLLASPKVSIPYNSDYTWAAH